MSPIDTRRVSNVSEASTSGLPTVLSLSDQLKKDGMKRKLDHADLSNPILLTFDRDSQEYLPGEVITGKVYLKLTDLESFELKKISINVLGTGRVGWEGGFTTSESYLDATFIVTDKAQKLSPKQRSINFPFTYTLPLGPLPSSYLNEAYGSISYVMEVTAETDLPPKYPPLTTTESFLVDGVYDLKTEDPLLEARSEFFVRTPMTKACFGLCCNFNGKVELTIKLPRRGFLPGQRIPFSVQVWNKSTHNVRRMMARILEHSVFEPPEPEEGSRADTRPFGPVLGDGLKQKSMVIWKETLTLPASLTPSTPTITPCHLIKVGYSLEVEIVMTGRNTTNPRAQIPIAIGNLDKGTLAGIELDLRTQKKKRRTLQSIQVSGQE